MICVTITLYKRSTATSPHHPPSPHHHIETSPHHHIETSPHLITSSHFMQKSIFFFFLFWAMLAVVACKQNTTEPSSTTSASTTQANASLASLLDQYYEERMSYYPQEATQNGDNRFNDQLPNDISADFRGKVRAFYQKYQSEIQKIDRNSLNSNDQASYDIFTYEMKMNLEALTYDAAWQMPFNSFGACLSLWGSRAAAKVCNLLKP